LRSKAILEIAAERSWARYISTLAVSSGAGGVMVICRPQVSLVCKHYTRRIGSRRSRCYTPQSYFIFSDNHSGDQYDVRKARHRNQRQAWQGRRAGEAAGRALPRGAEGAGLSAVRNLPERG